MGASRKIMVFALTAILIMSAVFAMSSLGAGAGPVVGDADPGGLGFVTLKLAPSEDTTLHSWFPFTNYGTDGKLLLHAGDVATALLKFDLSQIPNLSQAMLAQATLKLYAFAPQSRFSLSAVAYGVNRPWSAREANWYRATAGTNWSTPGCNGIPADRAATGSDPAEVSEVGKWVALDVTSIVQSWFDGSAANNGIIIKALPGDAAEYRLASADYYEVALRPVLQIIYATLPTPTPTGTPPPTVPEPKLEVVKTGPEGPLYDPNVTIHYDISVQNVGTDVAQGVVITDELPLGVVYVSCTGGGVYDPEGHTITWTIASLGISGTSRVEVNVRLAECLGAGGIVVNVVRANCPRCAGGPAMAQWSLVVGPPSPTPTGQVTPTVSPTPSVSPTTQPTRILMYLTNVRRFFRDVP